MEEEEEKIEAEEERHDGLMRMQNQTQLQLQSQEGCKYSRDFSQAAKQLTVQGMQLEILCVAL